MITASIIFILLLVAQEGICPASSFFAEPMRRSNFLATTSTMRKWKQDSRYSSRHTLSSRRLAPSLCSRTTEDDEKVGRKSTPSTALPIHENVDGRFANDNIDSISADKTAMFFANAVVERETIVVNPSFSNSLDNSDEKTSSTLEHQDIKDEEQKLPFSNDISDFILNPQSDLIDAGLVLLSSFTVAISTLPEESLSNILNPMVIYNVQEVLSYFFCIGYLLRWYAVGNLSLKYFTKPLPFIDFFASVMPLLLTNVIPLLGGNVPLWIASNNSALVNLRLLRILRLQGLLVDSETFSSVAKSLQIESVRPYQLKLAKVLITLFTLFSVATGFIYTAEHEVNPLIPDYFTAAYFGLTTLTTVGFGDITPITLNGRLVVMGSILVGVAVIPAQAAELVEALLDLQAERRQKDMMKNTLRSRMEGRGLVDDMVDPRISCPSCGKRSHRSDAFYCYFCGEKLWQ